MQKRKFFGHWCQSRNVKDFDKLCDLVLLEELKKCLLDKIDTYINEQKVSKVSDAAVLA